MARATTSKLKKSEPKKPDLRYQVGVPDWFLAHGEMRRMERTLPRSPEVQNYLNFLWPVALDYYSPLNPIFLNEVPNPGQLNRSPIWMARDGLVPLLWFFKLHPKPGRFSQKILVQEEFGPFVPDAWRENIGTYRIVSTPKTPLPKERKFLVSALLMDTFVSLNALDSQLKGVASRIGEDVLAKSEIIAFLPLKHDGYGNEHRHEYHSECIFRIARYLKAPIHSISWRRLDTQEQLDGYEVIELNEKLLCADSYLTQMPLFRGARLVGAEPDSVKLNRGEQLVAISPNHGVKIRLELGGKCLLQHAEDKEAANYLEKFAEAMRSEANKRFPWPSWFAEWTRVIEH